MWDRPVPSVSRYIDTRSNLNSTKLACFDWDWTLIRPVHSRFPTSPQDMALLPARKEILSYLVEQGYALVIFTNQKSKNETEVSRKQARAQYFIELLGLPVVMLMALHDDSYRKPNPGLWSLLPFTSAVDMSQSFYVGDAGGRPTDFSADDKLFAENVGLTYLTPEDFFPVRITPIRPDHHLVILMGMPGAGKSELYQKKYAPHNYVYLSQDILKTREKVLTQLKKALFTGQSIIIDATNPTREGRITYSQLAQSAGYQVDIVYVVRNGYEANKKRTKPVPDIAYNLYFSRLEEPSIGEVNGGIYEID